MTKNQRLNLILFIMNIGAAWGSEEPTVRIVAFVVALANAALFVWGKE